MNVIQAMRISRAKHKPFRKKGDSKIYQIVNFGIAEKTIFYDTDISATEYADTGRDVIGWLDGFEPEEIAADDWEILE